MPDMNAIPGNLKAFRDQCAEGVRQSVSMVTSMEHALHDERARRQQAEEDCKVLLAAIDLERGAGAEMNLLQKEARELSAKIKQGQPLAIPAEELGKANKAATTIQKVVRGNQARKEFEATLTDIIKGVDPSLDPANLSPAGTKHISNVNNTNRRQPTYLTEDTIDRTRGKESDVRRRMSMLGPDVGRTTDEANAVDLKHLLEDGYPASSARVVAALARRCRDLQTALVQSTQQLDRANMAADGLQETNMRVLELSQVHTELEEERQAREKMRYTVSRLRNVVDAQATMMNGGVDPNASQQNPYLAAFYRKTFAENEFQEYPPRGDGARVYVLDGPDADVEFWPDLKSSVPDPILIGRSDPRQYHDLLTLQRDLQSSAHQGPMDPLYYSPVPDTTFFKYQRDTPIAPVQAPGAPPQPVYTLIPLIREDAYMSRAPDSHPGFQAPAINSQRNSLPSFSPNPRYSTELQPSVHINGSASPRQSYSPPNPPAAAPYLPQPAYVLPPHNAPNVSGWTPGYTPPGTPPEFDYLSDTPKARNLPGHPGEARTVYPYLRDGPSPRSYSPAPAPVAASGPPMMMMMQPQSAAGMGAINYPPSKPITPPPEPVPPGAVMMAPPSQRAPSRDEAPPAPQPVPVNKSAPPPSAFDYAKETPIVPLMLPGQRKPVDVVSNLPLIRDAPDPRIASRANEPLTYGGPLQRGIPTQGQIWTPGYTPSATPPEFDYQKNTPIATFPGQTSPMRTNYPYVQDKVLYHPPHGQAYTPGYTPSPTPPEFDYQKNTPLAPGYSSPMRTNQPYIRDTNPAAYQGPIQVTQQRTLYPSTYTPGYTPSPTPPEFDYSTNTPVQSNVPGYQQPVRTNQSYIRDASVPPPPPPYAYTPGYTPSATPPEFDYSTNTPVQSNVPGYQQPVRTNVGYISEPQGRY